MTLVTVFLEQVVVLGINDINGGGCRSIGCIKGGCQDTIIFNKNITD